MQKTIEEIEGILICEMLTPTNDTRKDRMLIVEKMEDGNFGYPIHYKLLRGYNTFVANKSDWNKAIVYSDLSPSERRHLYVCVLSSTLGLP